MQLPEFMFDLHCIAIFECTGVFHDTPFAWLASHLLMQHKMEQLLPVCLECEQVQVLIWLERQTKYHWIAAKTSLSPALPLLHMLLI